MGKINASEMKRIIAAMKRRDPLTDATGSLFQRPHRRMHRGSDEGSIRRSLEESGLDFDEIKKINKTLRRGQMERLRAREKQPARDEPSIATAKEVLHRWVEEQRRGAERFPPLNPPKFPARVYLDTPFLIWANPPSGLLDSKAEAWHSTAQFGVDYIDEIPSNDHNADAWVTFYFLWENDFGLSEDQSQAFYVSTETFLVVKGHGDCYARAGLIPLSDASSALGWSATLRILYWRKDLGTSPPPDPDQLALITELSAHDTSKGPFLPFKGDRQLIDVFRGYPLAHSNFTVGAGGLVVFEVTLNVASRLEGGGWCNSLFWNNFGFVACPYVELQLTPRVPV